jgi:radical SAM protein with 4Fe4S-binding SPASM domain
LRLCLRRLRLRLCRRRTLTGSERIMFNGIQTTFQHLKTRLMSQDLSKHTPGGVQLYHYDIHGTGERSRVHLRIDADGSGLVLVNANRVMHLNPSAAFMAKLALEATPTGRAIQAICKTYQVSVEQAQGDYAQFTGTLEELVRPDGACPIHELDVDVTAPFSARPSAPYRMDLALTYRCNNDCPHCYNGRPRDFSELTTGEWKAILDQLWALGIPHVVFTGGEPTLRSDLPELIAHAESNGQITGLNTNARRLRDCRFVDSLVEAGLDHVQITVESHDAQIHDRMVHARGAWKQTIAGLENALATPLYVMTNTTMLQENSLFLAETLEFLSGLGVPTIGLNALIYSGHGRSVGTGLREGQLTPLLELARSHTSAHNQRLIWYTPTQYCNFDPMQLELGVKGCTAALYNMCVEPDGGVLPCQSYYYQMGNLLKDPWDSIWEHDLAISLRERRYVPQACNQCSLLSECGGGCPLTLIDELPRDNRPYLEL